MILAIIVLVVIVIIFREQIGTIVKNLGFLTPNETAVKNVSECLNNPGAPGCEGTMKFP
jgi:hypothetical protein